MDNTIESIESIYVIDIDFDDASKQWRKNKRYLGNGYFEYKCRHISSKNGSYCRNKVFKEGLCKYHIRSLNNHLTYKLNL